MLSKSRDVVLIAVSEEHYGLGAVVYEGTVKPQAELVAEIDPMVGNGAQAAVIIGGWFKGQFLFE